MSLELFHADNPMFRSLLTLLILINFLSGCYRKKNNEEGSDSHNVSRNIHFFKLETNPFYQKIAEIIYNKNNI